jgi:hypothetical protein
MLEKTRNYKVAKEAYARNENIVQKLTSLGVDKSACIEIAYEIQAGSYTSLYYSSCFCVALIEPRYGVNFVNESLFT